MVASTPVSLLPPRSIVKVVAIRRAARLAILSVSGVWLVRDFCSLLIHSRIVFSRAALSIAVIALSSLCRAAGLDRSMSSISVAIRMDW